MNLEIPNIYRSPLGLPLNWRDEVSGKLRSAIEAYLDNRIDGTQLTADDFNLVRAFLAHYIGAPCWNHMLEDEEMGAVLTNLRSGVQELKTPDGISQWISSCLGVGLDPL